MVTNLLQRGMGFLQRGLPVAAGLMITVRRDDETIQLAAVTGKTEFQIDDGYGNIRTEHTDCDFIVSAADYIFGGVVATPIRGDRIEVISGVTGETETFEVMAPGGKRPYLLDFMKSRLRIHTKRVL